MASCEATGPPGRFCVSPASVVISVKPLKFCTTPPAIRTIAPTIESGSSSRNDAAEQVDPEVADRARPAARESAHQGDRDGDADRGRHEVLHGEPGELHGVAHRELGRVRLPVRVRDERGRGVERQPLGHGGEAERVREHRLGALQDVDEEHADDREREHAAQVAPATTARSAGRRRRSGRGRARPASPSSTCRCAPCSRRAGGRGARGSGRGWPPAGRRAARPSEPLRLDEGVHEVHHGGDTQRGGEQLEDDHSFSTPFAMRPTTTNTAMMRDDVDHDRARGLQECGDRRPRARRAGSVSTAHPMQHPSGCRGADPHGSLTSPRAIRTPPSRGRPSGCAWRVASRASKPPGVRYRVLHGSVGGRLGRHRGDLVDRARGRSRMPPVGPAHPARRRPVAAHRGGRHRPGARFDRALVRGGRVPPAPPERGGARVRAGSRGGARLLQAARARSAAPARAAAAGGASSATSG